MVAIDGTRMAGNAGRESTQRFEEIAREILAEAKAIDAAEDELYGDQRADENRRLATSGRSRHSGRLLC